MLKYYFLVNVNLLFLFFLSINQHSHRQKKMGSVQVCLCQTQQTCKDKNSKPHLCLHNNIDHDIRNCGKEWIHQCLALGCIQYVHIADYLTQGQYCDKHWQFAPCCRLCSRPKPELRKTDDICWKCSIKYCSQCHKYQTKEQKQNDIEVVCYDCSLECKGSCGWQTISPGITNRRIWDQIPAPCEFHAIQNCQGIIILPFVGCLDKNIIQSCTRSLPFPGNFLCNTCSSPSESKARQLLILKLQACESLVGKSIMY